MSSTPVLTTYDPNRDTKVLADASLYGLGGVLLQKLKEEWKPITCALWVLTPTEQRYAQVDKEALGLMRACKRFRDFSLENSSALGLTMNPILSRLGGQALDLLPPRIQHFRMRLMH